MTRQALVSQNRAHVAIEIDLVVRRGKLADRIGRIQNQYHDDRNMAKTQDRGPRDGVGSTCGKYTSPLARVAGECVAIGCSYDPLLTRQSQPIRLANRLPSHQDLDFHGSSDRHNKADEEPNRAEATSLPRRAVCRRTCPLHLLWLQRSIKAV